MYVEEVVPGAISIVRGGIDTELAAAFGAELTSLCFPSTDIASKRHRVPQVFETMLHAGHVLRDADSAGTHVLALLGVDDPRFDLYVNYQQGMARQDFHLDTEVDDVDEDIRVLYCHGGGYFDYSLSARNEIEAEEDFASLPVNAGDVVVQSTTQIMHRGRNNTQTPRITVAIARLREF